jgi:Acetyltransferase (GNAT) domain
VRVDEMNSVIMIDSSEWDASLGSHFFYASSGWLAVAEKTADIPPFYLRAGSPGSSAVATLPCYPIAIDSPFPFCRVEFLATRFVTACASDNGALLAGELMPALFLGGRNPAHTGFGTAGVNSIAEGESASHALAAYAERAAADRGLRSVGMLYVDADDEVARRVLVERGYVAFPHYEAAILDVPGGGLNGYVHSLTPNGFKSARRELNKLANACTRYETCSFAPEVSSDVDRLEANLNRKYGGTFDDEAVRRLRETIGEILGDRVQIALARIDDRVVGSLVFMRWRDELYVRTAGFDYELIEGLPVYFGLMFYYLIAHAQRSSVRVIHYSTGSEEAKRRRGCRLVRQYAYVKGIDTRLHDAFADAVSGKQQLPGS